MLLCLAIPLLAQPRIAKARSTQLIGLEDITQPVQTENLANTNAKYITDPQETDKTDPESSTVRTPFHDEESSYEEEFNGVKHEKVTDPEEVLDSDNYEKTETEYTDDDLFCLAAVIWQEAGSLECSDQLQLMVASVVLNHVDNPNFPNTIRAVLERDGAYGTMAWTGISIPDPTNEWECEAIERCYTNARRVLDGERWVPPNVIYQAGFIQGSGVYDFVEGVYFCYE